MAINRVTVDNIARQALSEIQAARVFKQGKVKNWQLNEQLYYGTYKKLVEARASVQLGRMQEFVHTILSKIDNPLSFKFTRRKPSQLKRVTLLNALRQADQFRGDWDIKDIVGKKQAIIYGRAIYSYYADSVDGYKSHLEPIDVYDFLVDPQCGGIDIEAARHMGDCSVVLDKRMLKEGAKKGLYIKSAVKELLDGSGEDPATQEKTNKLARTNDQSTTTQRSSSDTSKYRFWRWFTTYQEDGLRYYLLMDNQGRCVRCELLTDLYTPTDEFPLGAYPYWSWAPFPDLTEFWTPSYCDYAREIFMAQDVSINQMLDNAEAINKPMKLVNVNAIENLAELKYRRDGTIKVKGDIDINRAFQTVQTPSINTPIQVFNILEGISQKATGVTAAASGTEDTRGKVGIYEGNQEASADRFGLLNKSYSFGYKRFAKLYEIGVRDNLIKSVAVEIVGPRGVEVKKVKRSDIFRKDDDFGVSVEASNAETQLSNQTKTTKIEFLRARANSPIQNPKKAYEIEASISGFTEDEIDELLDVSYFGNARLMSQADEDLEDIIEGKDVKPRHDANNAYKQKLVDFMKEEMDNLTNDQFSRLTAYIDSLEPFIMKNEARALVNQQLNQPQQSQQL